MRVVRISGGSNNFTIELFKLSNRIGKLSNFCWTNQRKIKRIPNEKNIVPSEMMKGYFFKFVDVPRLCLE
jgi:hypothetical protein